METFNFEFYVPRNGVYPNGDAVKMGKGNEFGIKPLLPIQRSFIVEFSGGLKWYLVNGTPVNNQNPTRNILALQEFYERHMMWKRFIFPHPIYGNTEVRFKDPFNPPKALPGGSGWTEGFEMTLTEQPT